MITQEQRNNIINWIAALRSGEYQQTTKRLQRADGSCCGLGVACNLFGVPKRLEQNYYTFTLNGLEFSCFMPIDFFERKFGNILNKSKIVGLNDHGKTFEEIANYIEKQLEEYETL